MSALLDDGDVWNGEGKRPVRSLAEFARAEIENRILLGHFAPGDRLEEAALARQLGISRTPVREAIRQLHAAQLVEHQPNKRPSLAKLNYQDLAKLLETASEIEALCARYCAMRIGELGRRQLRLICADYDRAVENGKADQCIVLNELFHEAVWRGAANASLSETARGIWRRLSPYRRYQFGSHALLEASQLAQTSIFDAIVKADAQLAWERMREHVNLAGFAVLETVFGRVVTHERFYGDPPG